MDSLSTAGYGAETGQAPSLRECILSESFNFSFFRGQQFIAYEGYPGAVGRPGGNIHRALSAEEFGQDRDFVVAPGFDLAAIYVHDAQLDIFAWRMADY